MDTADPISDLGPKQVQLIEITIELYILTNDNNIYCDIITTTISLATLLTLFISSPIFPISCLLHHPAALLTILLP